MNEKDGKRSTGSRAVEIWERLPGVKSIGQPRLSEKLQDERVEKTILIFSMLELADSFTYN